MAHKDMEGGLTLGQTFLIWAALWAVILFLMVGCGGGEGEAPTVAQEVPKYHVPVTPDPCTTTYPCEKK